MRVARFVEFLAEQLRAAGHPDVSAVETHEISGIQQPLVRCADGTAFYLHAVGASPPRGDDFAKPETVVEREPGIPIVVRQREN